MVMTAMTTMPLFILGLQRSAAMALMMTAMMRLMRAAEKPVAMAIALAALLERIASHALLTAYARAGIAPRLAAVTEPALHATRM
jgi:hypothetical protein